MNNNQLAEVAKILGVSEDSITAMDDDIKNDMQSAFEQPSIQNDADKKALYDKPDEAAKSTDIPLDTLRSLDKD